MEFISCIKLCYNDEFKPLKEQLEREFGKLYSIEFYNEDHHKEKKKSIIIKASCGARLLPFCSVYDQNEELIKGFYSEVDECTFAHIGEYLNAKI